MYSISIGFTFKFRNIDTNDFYYSIQHTSDGKINYVLTSKL